MILWIYHDFFSILPKCVCSCSWPVPQDITCQVCREACLHLPPACVLLSCIHPFQVGSLLSSHMLRMTCFSPYLFPCESEISDGKTCMIVTSLCSSLLRELYIPSCLFHHRQFGMRTAFLVPCWTKQHPYLWRILFRRQFGREKEWEPA